MAESQSIEYKKSWRDEYLKWICCFANADGGKIYLGKDDNGVVVGLKDSGKLLEDLPNKIRDLLGILVPVNLCEADGKPNDLWLGFPFSTAYREVIGSHGSEKNVGEKLDEKLDEKLGKRRAAIIRLMIKNPNITVTEVGKNLGISRTAADKNIQILKKNGWVRRIGPAKGGQWEVIEQH